jgi:hypothetical protein
MDYPFTVGIDIKHYNWHWDVFEPTLDESIQMAELLQNPAKNVKEIQEMLAKILRSWNCIGRDGQPLPVTIEGIKQIPQSVLFEALISLAKALQAGFSDPKPLSTSLPTTEPRPETLKGIT